MLMIQTASYPRLLAPRLLAKLMMNSVLSVVLLTAILLPAPVTANENVLALVPENALGFVVVNRLADVSEKLEKHAQELELPLPDLLMMLKMKLGLTEELDEKGNLMLALLPPRTGEREPQPLVALPVSNYEKFLGRFQGDSSSDISEVEVAGQTVLIAHKDNYALLVNMENRGALQDLLNSTAKSPMAVKSLTKWIGKNDAAVVLLEPGLQLATKEAIQGLETAKGQFEGLELEGGQSEQVAMALDMYIQMLHLVKAEIQTAAEGLRIDEDGNFRFGGRARFTEGGRLAGLTGVAKSSEADLLADLPGGPYVGAFSAAWSSECSAALAKWSVSMMRYNPALGGLKLNAKEAEKFAQASALSMQNLRRMGMLMTPSTGDEGFLQNILGVFEVDNTKKYLANYQHAMQVWQDLIDQSESPNPMKMEASEVTVNGLQGIRISMDMKSLMQAQNSPPQASQMIEKMFGEGGKVTTHIIAADENTILLSYASAEAIDNKVATYLKSKTRLATEPGIAKIASLLGQQPDMVAYLSPQGTVAWISQMMQMALPPGVEAPEFPEFPKTLPIGFSAKMVADGFETELVVPAELPQVFKDFAQKMRR